VIEPKFAAIGSGAAGAINVAQASRLLIITGQAGRLRYISFRLVVVVSPIVVDAFPSDLWLLPVPPP